MAGPRPTENPVTFENAFAKTANAYNTVRAKFEALEFDSGFFSALKDLGVAAFGAHVEFRRLQVDQQCVG